MINVDEIFWTSVLWHTKKDITFTELMSGKTTKLKNKTEYVTMKKVREIAEI